MEQSTRTGDAPVADDGIVIDLREQSDVPGLPPLPFHRPSVGEDEIAEVVDTLRSGWLTTGPKTALFSDEFRATVDAPAALAVSSCTAGLHLGLIASGIGPGDVVYTTPITFAATVQVILHTGARPVLVDVEPDTLNMDPAALDAAVAATTDGRPAAVMPVHFAGHPCEMDHLLEVADRHGLAVVEDAAHSLPAAYKDRPIGAIGGTDTPHSVAFSFYATKNLGIGEGGMLTGDEALIETARQFSLHGMTRDAWKRYQGGSWRYDIAVEGYKYNFTDIQAAIGLHQLRRQGELQARRRQIVDRYQQAFGARSCFEIPVERDEVSSAWHLYVLRLRPEALRIDRARYIEELDARGIQTSVHFIPIHHHSHFESVLGIGPGAMPVADEAFDRYFSLPLYPSMSDADVDRVVTAVLTVADEFAA